jgi:exodeoxyribonuclease V alpha subunit
LTRPAVISVHGGVKFYGGAAKAARAYVERDRSRADGDGVAQRITATPDGAEQAGSMDGESYEQWVAGIDIDTGHKKGRVREDANALRFVEVTVNGPKTWSLAAAFIQTPRPALDEAQDRAAAEESRHGRVNWLHRVRRSAP